LTDELGPDEQPRSRIPGRPPVERPHAKADNDNADVRLSALVEPRHLRLEPGGTGSLTLRLRNTGSVVDEIRVELLGEPAGWGSVVPSVLRLYPDTQAEAVISLQPPRASRPRAGSIELRLAITSRERPAASIEESVGIELAPFDEITAALDPRYGSTKGEFTSAIKLGNRGNRPVEPSIRATDPQNALELTVRPERLAVEPGSEAIAWLHARPHRTIWFGNPRTYPFDVIVSDAAGTPRALDGRLEQLPLFPRWLATVGALLVVLAITGGVACGAGLVQCLPVAGPVQTAPPTPFVTVPPDTGPPDTAPPDTAPPDTAPPDTAPPDLSGCVLTIQNPLVRLHEEPDPFSLDVGPAPRDTYVPIDTRVVEFVPGSPARWFQIEAQGRTGWVEDDGIQIASKSDECP
jgi:hypothetical protein